MGAFGQDVLFLVCSHCRAPLSCQRSGASPLEPHRSCLGLQPQAGRARSSPAPSSCSGGRGESNSPGTGGTCPGPGSPWGSLILKAGRQKMLLPVNSTGAGLGLCPAQDHGASALGVGTAPLSLISNNSCLPSALDPEI